MALPPFGRIGQPPFANAAPAPYGAFLFIPALSFSVKSLFHRKFPTRMENQPRFPDFFAISAQSAGFHGEGRGFLDLNVHKFAVFHRRHADILGKQPREITGVLKADRGGDMLHAFTGGIKPGLRLADASPEDILLEGIARPFLE